MKLASRSRLALDDRFIFTKTRQLRDQSTRRIDRDGIAVKDKLIITADGVAVKNRTLIRASERSDHLVSNARLPQRKRRCTQIDNDVGPLLDQTPHRFDIVE